MKTISHIKENPNVRCHNRVVFLLHLKRICSATHPHDQRIWTKCLKRLDSRHYIHKVCQCCRKFRTDWLLIIALECWQKWQRFMCNMSMTSWPNGCMQKIHAISNTAKKRHNCISCPLTAVNRHIIHIVQSVGVCHHCLSWSPFRSPWSRLLTFCKA